MVQRSSALAILAYLLLPTVLVIPMSLTSTPYIEFPPSGVSFQWYAKFLGSRDWLEPVSVSLRVASSTAIVATTLGTLASLALVRGAIPWPSFVRYLLLTPLVVPSIVSAVAVYGAYLRLGLVGNLWGLILAHTVMATPYVVLINAAGLQQIDRNLELAAHSLGAGRLSTLTHVTLPLIRRSTVTSAIFAFIVSLDEVVVSAFISSTRIKPLAVRMFEGIQFEIDPVVAASSALLTFVSLLGVAVVTLGLKGELSIGAPTRA